MQIIGRVFCKKINAQKRHKREAFPAGGGCRNPVCLCVSRHFSQFSLFVYIIHCDGIGVQTPDDAAKLNKITETEIYPNGINMTAFTDSLSLLRRYKVVDFNDDPGKDETMISIYNSILLLVSSSSLEELAGRLSKYVGVTEDEETTTDKAD